MKILVITPFFYPHIGGSEQYMEGLYVSLRKKYSSIKVDVLCYNTDKAKSQETYKGLRIYRVPCWNILPGKFVLPSPSALWNFLVNHKDYDLINTSTRFFDSSWWAPLWAKWNGTKVVLTDHCAGTPQDSNPLISWIVGIVDSITGNLFLRFYDQIFVVSKATQTFLKKKFNVSSKVLYAGHDPERAKRVEGRRFNKKVQIVFAGRMIAQKGVYQLLEVARTMPDVDFIFAGPGKLRLHPKGVGMNIKIVGKLDKKKLAKLLSSSDIFVLPSLHSEGIPMALLEAGAAKLAVVATNVGGVREVVEDGETGLLIKPNNLEDLENALRTLIRSSVLRRKLGNALYTHIKTNFNWEKSAKKFYTLIHAKLN